VIILIACSLESYSQFECDEISWVFTSELLHILSPFSFYVCYFAPDLHFCGKSVTLTSQSVVGIPSTRRFRVWIQLRWWWFRPCHEIFRTSVVFYPLKHRNVHHYIHWFKTSLQWWSHLPTSWSIDSNCLSPLSIHYNIVDEIHPLALGENMKWLSDFLLDTNSSVTTIGYADTPNFFPINRFLFNYCFSRIGFHSSILTLTIIVTLLTFI
jgi:hypothetical protein